MPFNDTLETLGKAKIVKRVVSSTFDGLFDFYVFKVRAELVNGWMLDYWEHKTAQFRRYSFHVFYNRQMIIRWDNTPHYPKLAGFPNHKHEGKTVSPSDEMTLAAVLDLLENLTQN